MAHYVFYLQDGGVCISCGDRKSAEVLRYIAWQDKGELEPFIKKLSDVDRLSLIIDMVDEDLDFVWRPKLFPWEKASYLKLEAQRTRNEGAMLSKLWWTGLTRKEEEGRKEELLSKAIVHQNDNIVFLLNLIEESEKRLTSIHSTTFLLFDWLQNEVKKQLRLSAKQLKQPFFMLVRLSQFRFRQLFIYEGQIRLSREIELDEHLESELAIQTAALVETKATLKYLYNEKILPYDSPVSLLILDQFHSGVPHWEPVVKVEYTLPNWQEDEWFLKVSSLQQVFKRWKLKDSDIQGSELLSFYVIKKRVPTFYETPYLQRVTTDHTLYIATITGNLTLFGLFLFYIVYQGLNTYFLQQKIALYQQEQVKFQQEKQALQSLVKLTFDAKDLKASVEFSQRLEALKGKVATGFSWVPISQVLDRSSHIQLSEMAWKVEPKIDSAYYSVTLKGWVYPFEEAYEPLVGWADELVQNLSELPNVQSVALTKEPLNRDLSQALTISATAEPVKALPFELTFKVARAEKPAAKPLPKSSLVGAP